MKNINHIDELLKTSFSNFEATPPPDAWSGIQTGLKNTGTPGMQSATTKTASVVKSAGIISKIALIALTSGIAIAGGYFLYQYYDKNTETEMKTSVQKAQAYPVIEQKKDENSSVKNQSPTQENTKTILSTPTHPREGIKTNSAPGGKADEIVIDHETKTPPANKSAPSVGEPKTTVVQAKTEQKQVLPKPNHQIAPPENPSPSKPGADDESIFVKPEIGDIFSPDGDGLNDKFEIKINHEIYYSLKIYDKEHNLVFESDSKEKTWDGTKMNLGETCDVGFYTYTFNFQYKNSDKPHSKSGVIELVR